jgi:hypothetical protein
MASLSEAGFQKLVTDRCDELGILWFHDSSPRFNHCPRGFPDLIITGKHGPILFAELKSGNGMTNLDQQRWSRAIRRGGGHYRLWKPADWESGLIQRELRELAECDAA